MAIKKIEELTSPLSSKKVEVKEKEVASEIGPYDFSGYYDMYTDMKADDRLPDYIKTFEDFMENLGDLDISPNDFVKRRTTTTKQLAMSDPDPMADRNDMMESLAERYFGKRLRDLTNDEILELEENFEELISRTGTRRPEGVMQLAGASGDNVIMSAIMWASTQPEFGSIDAVLQSLQEGSTTMNGLVNAYMDAKGDMS